MSMKWASCFLSFAVILFALSGCEGDDGMQGATGPAGPTGATGPQGLPGDPGDPGTGDGLTEVGDAAAITAQISSVTIASQPEVNFSLVDETGNPTIGLTKSNIDLTIARLVPGVDGNASEWQSYITRIEDADGEEPDSLDTAVQATTEDGDDGELIDNEDGTYVYTFAVDLDAAAVAYDDTLTHRVAIQFRGVAESTDNAVYTWRPSDGAISEIFTREIVETESCNVCHAKLALHGGRRFDAGYCVTCHNPGSTDQDSGNTVDMKVMIHKIHRGASLPSVEAGGQYVIYGFREGEHDYSNVAFPQDIRNCRNCHDETNGATPDAVNWLEKPTQEACGSCHDDVDFVTGEGHLVGPATNAQCTDCHRTDGFAGPIDESHAILSQVLAADYQYNIVEVVDTAPGEFPTVTFSVTDADGEFYDIQNDDPFTFEGGDSRLAIDLGWSTSDYQNTGSGSEIPGFRPGSPAQMVSLNPLGGGATDNEDGTFSITSGVMIPLDVTGSGLVAIEGHPAEIVNEGTINEEIIEVTPAGATAFFAITDDEAEPRRPVVALENCLTCHQSLSLHGGNRTDNIDLCVGCHNPDATDIRAREEAGVDATTSADGLDEVSVDFKRMIHRIHYGGESENGVYVYGFGGSLHDYSHVIFPGELDKLKQCDVCHDGNTFYPVGADVLATTIDSGEDLGDPTDDINITPNAAVCSSCHESALATAHMTHNGGAFDAMQSADGTMISASEGTVIETCVLCHGPGADADIREVHGF
ncbi:MAG: OmcA/MtrC family decaheme c-type cytochrome [Gammaproteobacteria bacterium]|nr:OmcA/MtrC family decaheme c-type cytochrome [Gammaproteobacteria bacterium]